MESWNWRPREKIKKCSGTHMCMQYVVQKLYGYVTRGKKNIFFRAVGTKKNWNETEIWKVQCISMLTNGWMPLHRFSYCNAWLSNYQIVDDNITDLRIFALMVCVCVCIFDRFGNKIQRKKKKINLWTNPNPIIRTAEAAAITCACVCVPVLKYMFCVIMQARYFANFTKNWRTKKEELNIIQPKNYTTTIIGTQLRPRPHPYLHTNVRNDQKEEKIAMRTQIDWHST